MSEAREEDAILRELARRVGKALEGRRYRLYLFGSRARGEAGPRSDYDLAVWADPPLDLATVARLREELEQVNILQHVDLVELSWAPGLRETVEREGVVLGEAG